MEDNPYLKFLRKSPKHAASWRPKDEYDLSGRGLAGAKGLLMDPSRSVKEKADTITNAVSTDRKTIVS